ncbi:MAG: SAM-dependent methyltransferase [Chloroflexi bacterium]|nr:SAM-dependent methyltransferase [Chloroflexota bacterium]
MGPSTPTPAEALLLERLAACGRLTFAEFMELALYAPEVGYYASQAVLGAQGDYVTSPELHPAFGALLGRQVEDCWRALDRPAPFYVREVGAGSGALCRDLLAWTRVAAPDLEEALTYELVERSPALRARQADTLAHAGLASARVEWLGPGLEVGGWRLNPTSNLQPPTRSLVGCVLSNELLDSFPVHLVTMRQGGLRELYVARAGDGFALVEDAPSTPALEAYFARLGLRPGEGCRAEVNLAAMDWMAAVAGWLERGLVLTLDYGHLAPELYSPRRRLGTLLCYYRHTLSSDPLRRIGHQDLTSHVDFTTLAETGERHGLRTLGLIGQARLLTQLGLPAWGERLGQLPSLEREANQRALRELVDPDGLGRVGALFQQRGLDDYVPLGLRPDAPPPDPSCLPMLAPDALRLPSPAELDSLADFEPMWRAFVSGDETELDG